MRGLVEEGLRAGRTPRTQWGPLLELMQEAAQAISEVANGRWAKLLGSRYSMHSISTSCYWFHPVLETVSNVTCDISPQQRQQSCDWLLRATGYLHMNFVAWNDFRSVHAASPVEVHSIHSNVQGHASVSRHPKL